MSEIIIAALIGACAAIINTFISAWFRKREKGNDDVGDTVVIHTTNTEYIPIPVELEKEGLISSLIYYAKRISSFIIIILCYAIFTGLGAWTGYNYMNETGWAIGLLIGLLVGFLIVRKIKTIRQVSE